MSLSTILTTIETDVTADVQKAITAGESWFKSFTPVAEADLASAWTKLQPIAMGLIAGIEQIALSGLVPGATIDKLAVASTGLVAAAATQGITIDKATAATLLQQAVTSIGNAAQSAITPPA